MPLFKTILASTHYRRVRELLAYNNMRVDECRKLRQELRSMNRAYAEIVVVLDRVTKEKSELEDALRDMIKDRDVLLTKLISRSTL